MATDFRISTGLPDHHKTQKVISRLGTGAMWHWICLCSWTARNRPDGDLRGMTVEDIELAAKWPDFRFRGGCYKGQSSRGIFVRVLLEVAFLEQVDDNLPTIRWHDWDKHQTWVCKEDSRKELASKAAQVRWDAKRAKLQALTVAQSVIAHAERIAEEEEAHTRSNAENEIRNAPSPSPSPIPSPTPTLEKAAKRGSRIPKGFSVTKEHRDFAREHGYVDPDAEIQTFRDYWTAKPGAGGLKLDWDATFRVWLSKARKYGVNNATVNKAQQRQDSNISAAKAAIARITGVDRGRVDSTCDSHEGDAHRGDSGAVRETSVRPSPITLEGIIHKMP